VPLPEVHLVEARDRRARGEVTDGRADGTFARLALDAEGRTRAKVVFPTCLGPPTKTIFFCRAASTDV
jgi:hypothetical protein